MLRALLGTLKQPLILVDWSLINAEANLFLLRAAGTKSGGRVTAICIARPGAAQRP